MPLFLLTRISAVPWRYRGREERADESLEGEGRVKDTIAVAD
jgi:hypothetical protein